MIEDGSGNFVIRDREQLMYALTEAATVEHLLMCQYLYAAASLKTHVDEMGRSPRRYHQLELMRYWKRKLNEVAREEMQHLAIAMNLLIAVGGAPTFSRPNFPAINRYYRDEANPLGITMTLEKFSPETVKRFIRFEQPLSIPVEAAAFVPGPNLYDRIGELYSAIKRAFREIPDVIVEVDDQYEPTDEGGSAVSLRHRPSQKSTITSVEDAEKAIDFIVYHGEGDGDGADPRSHYFVFSKIMERYDEELAIEPSFEPARDVVANPLTWQRAGENSDTATVVAPDVDGGLPHDMLQLFAGSYELLLLWLGRLYSRPKPSSNTENSKMARAIETLAYFPYMTEVISPIAELLTRFPVVGLGGKRLGPSFEITSNSSMVPTVETTFALSLERLDKLAGLAKSLSQRMHAASGSSDVTTQLDFVNKTLSLMKEELESREKYPWIPDEKYWDSKFSEQVPRLFAYATKDRSSGRGPTQVFSLLELRFEGWYQCRLATDPDGAAVARGVTGNAFAIGDEPDLDRIIRLQPSGAVERVDTPKIGTRVVSARLFDDDPSALEGDPIDVLVGANVDLLGDPKFEGRNHLVSEDGEPIDPFHLEIATADREIVLQRTVLGETSINNMTPLQRRGTGRYPVSLALNTQAGGEHLALLGRHDPDFLYASPRDFTEDRIARLQERLKTLTPEGAETTAEGAALKFRIQCLNEGLLPRSAPDARGIRWTRYFFDVKYQHFISGRMHLQTDGLAHLLTPLDGQGEGGPSKGNSWLVEYRFGYFDSDALAAAMSGRLLIPVRRSAKVPTPAETN